MQLAGRTAFITGGAAGIGRATALRFAEAGAAVAIFDLSATEGAAVVEEIRAAGGRAIYQAGSVTDPVAVKAAVAHAVSEFGGIHVLVTCAGILQGAFQQVDELDLETFDRVLAVNVRGTFVACQHAAPAIEASGGGVVLCIASGGGVQGPSSSLVYGASKAAVHGFCRTLEKQLGERGIRVNVVCPGTIDTAMKRQNVHDAARFHGEDPDEALVAARLGDPDGVAKVLTFLASSDADYVLGTVFTR